MRSRAERNSNYVPKVAFAGGATCSGAAVRQDMTDATSPFELGDDDAEALGRRFASCRVEEALEAVEELSDFDYSFRCWILWELQRRGEIDLAAMPEAWHRLAERPLVAPPELVAGVLSRVSAFHSDEDDGYDEYDEYDDEYGDYDFEPDCEEEDEEDDSERAYKLLLQYDWPRALDVLATAAYQAKPELFDGWREWPEPVRRGVAFSLLRCGVELTPSELETLRIDLARRDIGGQLHTVIEVHASGNDDDVVEDRRLLDDGYGRLRKPTDAYHQLVDQLGGTDAWGRAMLHAVLEKGYGIDPCRAAPALAVAPLEQLAPIFAQLDAPREAAIYHTLLHVRSDPWASLLDVADALTEDRRPRDGDCVRACAVLLAMRAGETVPEDFDATFNATGVCLRDCYRPELRPDVGRDETIAALRALGPERARAILLRRIEGEAYEAASVIPVLDAVSDWPALADQVLQILLPRMEDCSETAFSWRPLGPDVVPLLLAAHDAQVPGEGREVLQHSILEIAAEMADRGQVPDAKWDRLLSIVGHDTRSRFSNEVIKSLRRIITKLPEDRARAVIERALDPEYPQFPRVFGLLQVCPFTDLLERAMLLLGQRFERAAEPSLRFVTDALSKLEDQTHAAVRVAMEAHGSPRLAELFVSGLRQWGFDRAMEGSASATRAETKVEKVLRLAAPHQDRDDLVRIYLIESNWDAEVEPHVIGREGTTPIGVDQSNWPRNTDDGDFEVVRQAHLFTLPLADIPELRESYPDAEALAFFIRHPFHHKAYTPGNGETTLLPLTAEDLQRGEPSMPEREAHPLEITPVDVPSAMFFIVDEALEELRKAVYQVQARVLGAPLWLQDAEHDGELVIQFDEAFASVNLGDCGLMFVFRDTAFMQCH